MVAAHHLQTRGFHQRRGVVDRVGHLIGQDFVPLVVHAERRVGPVMVVSGADHDLGNLAQVGRQQGPSATLDLGSIGGEDHVHVGGRHDDELVASAESEGRCAQVVVHPGSILVAVAHIDAALVPRRHEDADVVRLDVAPAGRVGHVAVVAVHRGQDRVARCSGVQRHVTGAGWVGRNRVGGGRRAGRRDDRRLGSAVGLRLLRRVAPRTGRNSERQRDRDCTGLAHGTLPHLRAEPLRQ